MTDNEMIALRRMSHEVTVTSGGRPSRYFSHHIPKKETDGWILLILLFADGLKCKHVSHFLSGFVGSKNIGLVKQEVERQSESVPQTKTDLQTAQRSCWLINLWGLIILCLFLRTQDHSHPSYHYMCHSAAWTPLLLTDVKAATALSR